MPQVRLPDPFELIDERIRLVRARRSTCERFSDEYWAADDHLVWLRMVRDEIGRTGHIRLEVHAAMLATGAGVPVMAESAGSIDGDAGPIDGDRDGGGDFDARRARSAEDPALVAGLA